jgi:hypothetical protein
MTLKQAIRRLFFKSIDAELAYHTKEIDLLLQNIKLLERENAAQSKILLCYLETFQSLKRDEGLTIPFLEKEVVKYNV